MKIRNRKKLNQGLALYVFLCMLFLASTFIDKPYEEESVDGIEETANSVTMTRNLTAGVTLAVSDIVEETLSNETIILQNDTVETGTAIYQIVDSEGNIIDEYTVDDGSDEITYYECTMEGYAQSNVNVREEPNTDSEVLDVKYFNEIINYDIVDDEWVAIEYEESESGYAYISRDFIDNSQVEYVSSYDVNGDARKSYMSYKAITCKGSRAYKIEGMSGTGDYGLRMCKGRYLVAIGSYYGTTVGQYIDVVLENGTVIPCITGDAKDDKDTNSNHSIGADGGCVEFIICSDSISSTVKRSGDVSDACSEWDSPVVEIRVYDKNVL